MANPASDAPATHTRRPRYPGKNPRAFHDKYKELNPERYAADVQKMLASGKTPAGMHRPIMVEEVIECLRPPGDVAVDCTLGGGGHARALLERVPPGGRVIGLDVDPIELPRPRRGFARPVSGRRVRRAARPISPVWRRRSRPRASSPPTVLADLGVSSMQLDNPDRGFNYKGAARSTCG